MCTCSQAGIKSYRIMDRDLCELGIYICIAGIGFSTTHYIGQDTSFCWLVAHQIVRKLTHKIYIFPFERSLTWPYIHILACKRAGKLSTNNNNNNQNASWSTSFNKKQMANKLILSINAKYVRMKKISKLIRTQINNRTPKRKRN